MSKILYRSVFANGLSILVIFAFTVPATLQAQPITRGFNFPMPGRDTVQSNFFPHQETPAGLHGELHVNADGHILAKDGTRLKLFGTELEYTSNFITGADAHTLAQRLRKLGFNAVRLALNDYWPWDDASFFRLNDTSGTANYYNSYQINKAHLAEFDTLLFEFKQAGIYSVFTINSFHQYAYGEVPMRDSINAYYYWLLHLTEPNARELDRQWVKTFFTHVNPLTGVSYAAEPANAVAELNWQSTPYYYWQLGRLNWIDSNNVAPKGAYTVNYFLSRQFDTLWATFLKNKYGSDGSVTAAWVGNPNISNANLMADGSFEDVSSAPWSFVATNNAKASFVVADGGVDSTTFEKIRISDISANPALGNIYAQNLSTVLGIDSLYELTFWAKMGYDTKRPGVTSRTIYLYLYNYTIGGASLAQYATIDTTWRKFSFTFRAASSGLQGLVTYVGDQLGDVWLDAYNIHHKPELGLLAGESINNASVIRLTPANMAMFPLQRQRDMVMFLDSLQLAYYVPFKKLIRDTLHFSGLVNFTQQNYWVSPPDEYVNSFGDVTEGYVGWDGFNGRANKAFGDSNWTVQNIPELKSTYGGNLGYYLPAASVEGKPYLVNVQVPVVNQYSAEQISLIPTYAAYQDWDGVFITPFSNWRFDLFTDSIANPFTNGTNSGSANTIHNNNALLALAPSASAAFKSGAIHPADLYQAVEHDPDDVWLSPSKTNGRGPWGVEGYLDPNIITEVRVRQKFNARHKVSAQYAYLQGDTTLKVSDTREITWDQTNGQLRASSSRLNMVSGFYGADTAVLSKLKLSRRDGQRDLLSVSYLSLDSLALDSTSRSLLTISTRSQNSNAVWRDSMGYSPNWGTSPMIMSAASLDLQFKSTYDSVLIFPLDAVGALTGQKIAATHQLETGWFSAKIDQLTQQSAWFFVVKKNATSSVTPTILADGFKATLNPNPAITTTQLRITSKVAGEIGISLIDDLGRTVQSTTERVSIGSKNIPLDLSQIAVGHYTLKVAIGSGVVVQSLNVVR